MKYTIGSANSFKGVGGNNFATNFTNFGEVGRVYGVVTTENTPTKKMFEEVGGFSGIGTIFYKDYLTSTAIVGLPTDDEFLSSCKKAKPKFPNFQYYPIRGELVSLENLPSPSTQDIRNSIQAYYTIFNLWNNTQQNAQPANDDASLGLTFLENSNIRPLIPFEGDHIVGGRQGSSLRFSTTTKLFNNLNEWSAVGGENDPITILTNGLNFDPKKQYYVEQINRDASSIYLTSLQKIPLQTDKKGILNNLTNPLDAPDYFNSQVILNADRVTLNSKKDEVMIFAKTNVEINTKNVINLNADERVHLNSPAIFLGPYDTNNIPQPLLLGNNTYELLESLLDSLYNLGLSLSTVIGSPEGAPAVDINNAAGSLLNDLDRINDKLGGILSQQNFTV